VLSGFRGSATSVPSFNKPSNSSLHLTRPGGRAGELGRYAF
jgi:hypothetical protein